MKEAELMELKPTNSDPVTAQVMEVKDDLTAGIIEYLGVGPSMANRREYLVFFAASVLVSLGILSMLGYIYLWPYVQPYYAIISDKERISGLFRAAGAWAPIVYMVLEAGQVVTIFWPVPLEIVGGFLFGLPLGMLYSTVGLTFGAVLAFLLGRWLEKTYLRRLIDPGKLQRFRRLMKREGALAGFIIFLIPGVPKDFVSYVLGFTSLSLKFFVVAVIIFRLPSTFLLTLQGAEAAKGHYWLSLGLIGFNYFLAVLIYRYREYLYQWIKAWYLEEL
jgi:uncharacterized membrane protein YdjX (TVP38/TMEM64 family)